MKIKLSKIPVDRDTFVQDLIKRKQVRQIGAGKFGSVFAKPEDPTVIKVCRDDAYRSFIIQALKFQHNPWFPQVESATDYTPKDEAPFLVVVLERLRKGTTREIDGALCLFDNERFNDITAMFRMVGVQDETKLKHLSEVRKVLTKLYKSFGPDFHKGNIMFRNEQAVVTDPIVSGASATVAMTSAMDKNEEASTIPQVQ